MAAPLALPPAAEVLERTRQRDGVVVGAAIYGIAALMLGVALVGIYTTLRPGLSVWPPEGVRKENYFGSMNLAAAGMLFITAEWLVWSIREHVRRQAVLAGGLSALLLLAMLNATLYAAYEAGYGASAHSYAVVFYAFVAWSAATQVLALAAVFVALARLGGRQVSASEPQLARASSQLIHTAAVAWVVVWVALYASSR